MAETDIYKNREAMPQGNKPPKKKRRRRTDSQRAFDDRIRKRRSKNSGFRRFLHLSRKSENEKMFWGSIGILFVVILIIIGVWQFVVLEHMVRKEEKADDYLEPYRSIPEAPADTQRQPGKEPIVK